MSTFDPDNVPRFDFAYLRVAGDIHAKYVLAEDYDNLLRLYRRMESTKEVPMEFVPCPICGRPEHGGKP
jgi:hypothetical protein